MIGAAVPVVLPRVARALGPVGMVGVAVGGLLLGVLEAFSTGLLSSGYKDAIAFVLLLAFLFFRPEGLFGALKSGRR